MYDTKKRIKIYLSGSHQKISQLSSFHLWNHWKIGFGKTIWWWIKKNKWSLFRWFCYNILSDDSATTFSPRSQEKIADAGSNTTKGWGSELIGAWVTASFLALRWQTAFERFGYRQHFSEFVHNLILNSEILVKILDC